METLKRYLTMAAISFASIFVATLLFALGITLTILAVVAR